MAEIPRAVLSEFFQEQMRGGVLKSGVFLTFRFDAGFFEQEVLPVFLDVPLSHLAPVRLLQLEEAIRDQVDHLAVYYDPRALTGDEGPRLDVRRVPVRWPRGYFHPKNAFLLVEDAEPNDRGEREQRLLVATMSANLTQDGWWRNVEVCHVEELRLDEKSSLRGDLLKLFTRIRRASPPNEEHLALEALRRFVVRVEERGKRSANNVMHPRLYVGQADDSDALESVPEFLDRHVRRDLKLKLEVISPYFDDTSEAGTLHQLVEMFGPEEVRVYLPRDLDGRALCRGPFYEAVRKLPNTSWGKLPEDLLRSGSTESAAPRTVHAKVYRFFSEKPHYEAVFVGSVNLTGAAHQRGGNLETAFYIEQEPKRPPDWWLSVDRSRPAEFQQTSEEEGLSAGPGTALMLVYMWDSGEARAFWDHAERSPVLSIESAAPLFELGPLRPRSWVPLSEQHAAALGGILRTTSLLTVKVEGHEPASILVQEEGMAQKPSILLNLSVKDILRCWAALTPEQKAALQEARYQELVKVASALMPGAPLGKTDTETIFDAFAGVFHAFANLERKVVTALGAARDKEAVYLLFGKKYDSLPHLVHRLFGEEKQLDAVNRYVMLLCARQLIDRVKEVASPDFRAIHRSEFQELDEQLARASDVRQELRFAESGEQDAFFQWFEAWFLKRAEPMEGARP